MEAVIAEPFKSLDDLYSNLENLTLWPEVKDLRECAEYVYQGKQADVGSGELKKLHRDGQPRTIVCHDMKGGYLEDRYTEKKFHFLEDTATCFQIFHDKQKLNQLLCHFVKTLITQTFRILCALSDHEMFSDFLLFSLQSTKNELEKVTTFDEQ